MIGIQIIAILFALLMMYLAFVHMKRREFTAKESAAWFVIWICFMFVAIWPFYLNVFIKEVIRMQRPLDFYIILGFMFLIGTTFYSYTLIRMVQRKVDNLVEKMAIEKAEKKNESPSD